MNSCSIYWQKILLNFFHLRTLHFLLHSWRTFSLGTGFWVENYFFQYLKKNTMSEKLYIFSDLYGVRWEICSFHLFSPISKVPFSSPFSRYFLLSLDFRSSTAMHLGMDFFGFILFVVYSDSWICRFISLAQTGRFSAIISLSALPDKSISSLLGSLWYEC